MRRRIDPHDLDDLTDRVHLFDEERPYPVLYDEELWSQYETQWKVLRTLQKKIFAALTNEPYDEVELELARKDRENCEGEGPFDVTLGEEIRRLALENAQRAKKRT